MHLGLFIAIFASLLAIAALVTPVPGFFPVPAQDLRPPQEILRAATPRCLSLSYDDSEATRWLPGALQLESSRAAEYSFGNRVGYRARADSGEFSWIGAGWWGVGADSIDIEGHHTLRIRLPVGGDTLVGRAGLAWHESIFTAVVFTDQELDIGVRAVDVPCTSVAIPPAT